MTQPICSVCTKPVEHLQVRSGVTLSATEKMDGHYECVLESLGPTRGLGAIRAGLLPALQTDELVEGRLRKHVPYWTGEKRFRSLEDILSATAAGIAPAETPKED